MRIVLVLVIKSAFGNRSARHHASRPQNQSFRPSSPPTSDDETGKATRIEASNLPSPYPRRGRCKAIAIPHETPSPACYYRTPFNCCIHQLLTDTPIIHNPIRILLLVPNHPHPLPHSPTNPPTPTRRPPIIRCLLRLPHIVRPPLRQTPRKSQRM